MAVDFFCLFAGHATEQVLLRCRLLNTKLARHPAFHAQMNRACRDWSALVRAGLLEGKLNVPKDVDAPRPEDVLHAFEGR